MKKAFKILLSILLIITGLLILALIYVYFSGIPEYDPPKEPEYRIEPTAEKVEEGLRLAIMMCSHCHLGNDGRLSGGIMKDLDPMFGKVWASNITNDKQAGIGSWTSGQLAFALRTGLRPDGRYLPPWMPKYPGLSDKDLECVICFLKSDYPLVAASSIRQPERKPSLLAKLLTHTVMKPLPYPDKLIETPDTIDLVTFGKYLTHNRVECYSCHSADFKKLDIMVPEKSVGYMGGGNILYDLEGRKIASSNITMDKETGIGNWTYADFNRALKKAKRPDGISLRFPMRPYPELTDTEISGIWAYLKTVPVQSHKVERTRL